MELNSFSSVFNLAATFYIAFAAIEYVKSFSNLLYDNLFHLSLFLKEQLKQIKLLIIDNETLSNLSVHDINGKSINNVIESIKRNNELLIIDIENLEKNYEKRFRDACLSKDIQNMGITLFFVSLTALFLCGIENSCLNLAHWCWLLISIGMYVILFINLFFKTKRIGTFKSYIIVFISLLLCAFMCNNWLILNDHLWNILLIISVIILWLFVFTFLFSAYVQIKKTKKLLKKEIEDIKGKENYIKMLNDYKNLVGTHNLISDNYTIK